jgi:hypothetical protein
MIKKLIDPILSIIETYSGKINSWAWNIRWKNRKEGTGYQEEWITGHKKWKKQGIINDKVKLGEVLDEEYYNTEDDINKIKLWENDK